MESIYHHYSEDQISSVLEQFIYGDIYDICDILGYSDIICDCFKFHFFLFLDVYRGIDGLFFW